MASLVQPGGSSNTVGTSAGQLYAPENLVHRGDHESSQHLRRGVLEESEAAFHPPRLRAKLL